MNEIFENIPQRMREQAEFVVNLALQQKDIVSAVTALKAYADTCQSDEEREFVDFYFNLRMEQMLNENRDN